MNINEALDNLKLVPKEVHDGLNRFAADSGINLQLAQNLRSESRLTLECWTSLLPILCDRSDSETIGHNVRLALRLCILQGPLVSSPIERQFGHAVTRKRFRTVLEAQHFSYQGAAGALRHMLGKPLRLLHERWKEIEMGIYLIWATFNPNDDKESPFKDIDGSATMVMGLLGLDINEAGEPLLLFKYVLPEHVQPLFPTVAEAYAGDAWSYFFRPAPKESSYGMTLPWPEFQNWSPRPEVVHRPIKMSCVIEPLREIK
jgi:hypothetical protein